MTTLRQIHANQLNAQNSTGPKTTEGKLRSRRNALKHGLAGNGVVLPQHEALAVDRRAAEWHKEFRPRNAHERWLVHQVAVESIRIDRCQHHESILRCAQADRARFCWHDDRRLAAEVLGATLPKQPTLINRQLEQTSQGCDWLIERWIGLEAIAKQRGGWDQAQRELAFNLLGVPAELREEVILSAPEATAHDEIERLEQRKVAALDGLDDDEREASAMGVGTEEEKPLKQLRRYEAACQRRLRWGWKQLDGGHAEPPPAPSSPSPKDRQAELTPEQVESEIEALLGFVKGAAKDPFGPRPHERKVKTGGLHGPGALSQAASTCPDGGSQASRLSWRRTNPMVVWVREGSGNTGCRSAGAWA